MRGRGTGLASRPWVEDGSGAGPLEIERVVAFPHDAAVALSLGSGGASYASWTGRRTYPRSIGPTARVEPRKATQSG